MSSRGKIFLVSGIIILLTGFSSYYMTLTWPTKPKVVRFTNNKTKWKNTPYFLERFLQVATDENERRKRNIEMFRTMLGEKNFQKLEESYQKKNKWAPKCGYWRKLKLAGFDWMKFFQHSCKRIDFWNLHRNKFLTLLSILKTICHSTLFPLDQTNEFFYSILFYWRNCLLLKVMISQEFGLFLKWKFFRLKFWIYLPYLFQISTRTVILFLNTKFQIKSTPPRLVKCVVFVV
jgi:hypothetical protein